MRSRYIKAEDAEFPDRLREVKPEVKGLWCRGGGNQEIWQKTVAIIGSRRMSRYGKQVVAEIVPRFVAAGYTTISGLMYGIDTEVHKLTLENGGKTVAVLGYGIDCELDAEVRGIYTKMMQSGCLIISEYPGITRGQTWTFPQRNRIVVGLADLVVVAEAGIKSGSLNSASWARRQGKPVFAAPGSIFSATSEGSNLLISEGKAISLTLPRLFEALVKNTPDTLSHQKPPNPQQSRLSPSESTLLALLRLGGPQGVNELSRGTGKSAGEVAATLTSLLLRGEVEEERGVWVVT